MVARIVIRHYSDTFWELAGLFHGALAVQSARQIFPKPAARHHFPHRDTLNELGIPLAVPASLRRWHEVELSYREREAMVCEQHVAVK
jgi:hypothetical protein